VRHCTGLGAIIDRAGCFGRGAGGRQIACHDPGCVKQDVDLTAAGCSLG